jgi:hypothetical protein
MANMVKTCIRSLINMGSPGILVDIECHLSNSLPNITIVSFANKTVAASKEPVHAVFSSP